jgi:hypothetical protein
VSIFVCGDPFWGEISQFDLNVNVLSVCLNLAALDRMPRPSVRVRCTVCVGYNRAEVTVQMQPLPRYFLPCFSPRPPTTDRPGLWALYGTDANPGEIPLRSVNRIVQFP